MCGTAGIVRKKAMRDSAIIFNLRSFCFLFHATKPPNSTHRRTSRQKFASFFNGANSYAVSVEVTWRYLWCDGL